MPADNNTSQANRRKTRTQSVSDSNTMKDTPNTNTTDRVRTRRRDTDETEEDSSTTRTDESVCPECSGNVTHDAQRGEHACDDCGLVIDQDEIDHGPEWRAFDSAERDSKSRVGSPTNKMMHDDGLATNIDWRDKDAYGNSLGAKQRSKMKRLRKWNERTKTQDSHDRNLKQALGEINRMASALGLPRDVRKIASMIYRRCLENDMLPGRSIEGMATASLYAASRMDGIPRSLNEMEQVSRVDEKEIGRSYRYIDRELGLEIGPSDPLKYIPRFTADLDDVSQETERLARHLVEKMKDAELHSGKTPPGIAAAAIYMAGKLCNDCPTQTELSDVTGVTEVTIRERYQDMINHGEESWIRGP